MEINCKDCIFYSGIQCHGHGEFWGECNLYEQVRSILAKLNNVYRYDVVRKNELSVWDNALSDKSTCLFFEIKEKK